MPSHRPIDPLSPRPGSARDRRPRLPILRRPGALVPMLLGLAVVALVVYLALLRAG